MRSVLRDYQRKAFDLYMAKEDHHGTLSMFTGSGKTTVAVSIIQALGLKTIVVVPTLVLQRQWFTVFKAEGFKEQDVPDVLTYAWASQHADDLEGKYEFWVLDEAHHLAEGPVFQRLLVPIRIAPYALGLTATPPKPPQDGEEANLMLQELPVIFEHGYSDGLEQGYAAPVEVRPIGVQLNDEERKEYQRLSQIIRDLIARYGSVDRAVTKPAYKEPDVFDVYGNLVEEGKLVFGGAVMTMRKQVVAAASAKPAKVAEIIRGINETDAPQRIFVWSEYVKVLEMTAAYLNSVGITAVFVHGGMTKKQTIAVFEEWGTKYEVLLIAKVGEEGIDWPTVAHGIIIAGAKTSRQNVQRIGRLVRPQPGKVAKLWLVFAERTTEEKLVQLVDLVTE